MKETCDKCGAFAGFETSPEGELCGICDEWICQDCSDNSVAMLEFKLPDGRVITEDVICRNCAKELGLHKLKPVRAL